MAAAVIAVAVFLCASADRARAATLFAGNQTPSSISALQLSTSGQLSPVAGSPFVTSQEPRTLIGSPDGSRLFAGHRTINSIGRQAVAADGSLSTLGVDVAFAPTSPFYAAFSPDARHVYYSSAFNDGGLQHFAVGADGSLTPGGVTPVDSNGSGLAITPNGKFLYACSSTGGIHGFALGADGAPSALPGFPPPSASCTAAAVSPDGRFLLTAEPGWGLQVLAIGTAGELTGVGTNIVTGPNPNYIEVSPDGTRVYVLNIGAVAAAGTLAQFALAPDGTISQVGVEVPVTATGSIANGLAISPDGRYIAASSPTVSSNVHVFATNSGGQLTPVSGSPFNSGGSMAGGSPAGELTFRTNQGPSITGLTIGGKNRARTFAATGAADPDGAVTGYAWNFGDGTTTTTATPNTTHTYAKGGNYNASVRAIDDENCSAADIFDGRKFLCKSSATSSVARVADALPPSFSKLKFTKKSVVRGGKVKLKYKLSQAATVKVTFQTRKGKKYRSRGSLTFKSKAGSRARTLRLKIKKRKLPAGTYRVLIVGTDEARNTSSAKRLKLKVR